MRIQDLPRHLGQHSGGMVICQGQLNRVVPLERASMPGRTVVQWDKEDCANLGIIKVDLLGLGMMAVLKDCQELIPKHYGEAVDLAQLPEDDEVYRTLNVRIQSACFRWRAGRRWLLCRATILRSSMTWWYRSPSFGQANRR